MKSNFTLISFIALFLISFSAQAQEPGFTFAQVLDTFVRVKDLAKDNSGNIYVTGNFNSANAFFDFDPDPNYELLVPAPQSSRTFIFVAKYSPDGRCLWAFNIGNASTARIWSGNSTDNATGTSIGLTASGDVIVSGYYNGLNVDFDPAPGREDLHSSYSPCCVAYSAGFVAKYNTNGQWQWTREIKKDLQYGESGYVNKMTVSPAGDIYAYGSFTNSSLNTNTPVYFNPVNSTDTLRGSGSFIAKYNSTGSFLWVKRVAGINYTDMQAASDGGLVLGGSFQGSVDFDMSENEATLSSTAGSDDIFISKWNSDGSFAFVKNFFSTGSEGLDDLEIDPSGNIYFTGGFTNVILFTRPSAPGFSLDVDGSVNFLLAKCNSEGEIIWAKRIASLNNGFRESARLSLDPAGSSYITGGFNSSVIDVDPATNDRRLYQSTSQGYDYFVVKYTNQGDYQWGFSLGGQGDDAAIPLAVDNNQFYLFGTLPFNSTGLDANPGEATNMIAPGFGYVIGFDDCVPTVTYYPDLDGDGFGIVNGGITTCILPYSGRTRPYANNNKDCDDARPTSRPSSWYPDNDGDGYGSITSTPVIQCDPPAGYIGNKSDCDDNDPLVNIKTFYLDIDGDGYWTSSIEACSPPSPSWRDSNYPRINKNDCDDNNPSVWANSTWSRDQDGDGYVAIAYGCYSPGSDWTIYTGSSNNIDCDDMDPLKKTRLFYFFDNDNDGFGNSLISEYSCGQPAGNWVLNDDDCDDSNRELYPTTWYKDFDRDGLGSKKDSVFACTPPADAFWVNNNLDCNDSRFNTTAYSTDIPTLRATQNDDCSYTIEVTGGELKDASKWVFYRGSCGGEDALRLREGSSVSVYPSEYTSTNYYVRGESECVLGECAIINITTGSQPVYYGDIDADGWYTARKFCSDPGPQWSTTQPDNYAEKFDCDDSDDQINPAAPEICGNGIDENCDGLIDERPYYTVLSTSDSWKTYAGSVEEVYKTADYDDASWLTAVINPICSWSMGSAYPPGFSTPILAINHPYYLSAVTDNDVLFRKTFNVTDKETKQFLIEFFADTDVQIWLNGQLIIEEDITGGVVYSGKRDRSAYIINGVNTILVKVKNRSSGGGCFACRISSTPIVKFYADADGDGYGNPEIVVPSDSYCIPPTGATADNTDCDDNNYYLHETFTRYYDLDGDGYYATIKLCDITGLPSWYLSDNSSFFGPDCNDEDVTINAPYINITNYATYTGTLNVCAGEQIMLNYNSCATFSSSNLFQIQLSDKNGNFTEPVNVISSLNDASQSGSIGALIPFSTEPGNDYRLRIVSTDAPVIGQPYGTALKVRSTGCITSTSTNTNAASNAYAGTGVIAFPNPTNGKVNLKISNFNPGKAMVKVTDVLGRIIELRTLHIVKSEQVIQLELMNRAQGTYFIQVQQGYFRKTMTLIKQ
ncbi:MAG: T9SS type A sorting domain-containing protein [Bacteroidetes bacterium]|nr:T9SS type A sorting domain-containing protein [Bacteroidota bacterium]